MDQSSEKDWDETKLISLGSTDSNLRAQSIAYFSKLDAHIGEQIVVAAYAEREHLRAQLRRAQYVRIGIMVICAVIIFPFREPWLSVILFIFPAIYDMLPSTKRQTSDYRYQLLKRAIRCAPDFPFNVGKWDIGFLEKRDSFSLMALLRIADQIESSQGKMPELTEDAQRILLNMVLEYRYDWAPEANRRFLSVIQTYRHEIFCPELAREFEVSFPQTLGLGRQVADNRFGIHTPN